MDITITKKKEEGFTIIELLIACLIIVVGLLSVVSMILNAFTSTVSLSSNLTASYLAQEGFEVVRRIRDENFNERYFSGGSGDWYWAEGIIPEGDEGPISGSVHYESEGLEDKADDNLYIDSDGLFSYNTSGEETNFKRKMIIEEKNYTYQDDVTTEYLLVTAEITWNEKGEVKEYKASTKLFNWY